jgi:hypothetical protein
VFVRVCRNLSAFNYATGHEDVYGRGGKVARILILGIR